MKIAGSGSISQRHGSADPDPHQNVMDPKHWLPDNNLSRYAIAASQLLFPELCQKTMFILLAYYIKSELELLYNLWELGTE
jgi:hypothetical protein